MLFSAFTIGFWNILFWIFIGMMIGALIAWLLGIRTETATNRLDLSSLLGRTVTVREERTEVADELQAIEGVGPQIAELFHKNGIHRFHQLSEMTPSEITALLASGGSKFDIAQPFTWPFQARLLAGGLIAEHAALCARLSAGRLPLTGIKGLGPATAVRLSGVGINTVDELADADEAVLTEQLDAAGEVVAQSVVGGWIEHARKVTVGDFDHLAAYFDIPAAQMHGRPAVTYAVHRDVSGQLIDAHSLNGVAAGTATAVARPSLWPFWIGLIGAALLALLSALGLLKTPSMDLKLPKMPSLGISAFEAELGTDTTFETNSAVLTEAGKAEIEARIIGPARDLDVTSVQVVGHADVRGDDALNLDLSRNRAEAVAEYMREKVRAENIQWNPRVIEVYGAGEQFPNPNADTVTQCASLDPASQAASDCYAPDRRVDVTILAKGQQSEIEAAQEAANSEN